MAERGASGRARYAVGSVQFSFLALLSFQMNAKVRIKLLRIADSINVMRLLQLQLFFSFVTGMFILLFLEFCSLLFMVFCLATNAGIGCFVCSSFNQGNPECEDMFNSTVSQSAKGSIGNYQYPCWAFKKDRKGLFPADHCVKISGYQSKHPLSYYLFVLADDPSKTMVIRTCAMDSGTLTADTGKSYFLIQYSSIVKNNSWTHVD